MLSTLFHAAHVFAVVLWIGGVGYSLMVLLPSLSTVSLRDRARFVPKVLKRFLTIVWLSIAVVSLSGLYRMVAVMNITALPQLSSSHYGQLLSVKLVFVIFLLAVALSVTLRVYPKVTNHVRQHLDESPDVYRCPVCREISGLMRVHLMAGLSMAAAIILLAAFLRGA
ncbi:MAG: CopD family protein [Candidatus Caldarchaeum sp.]|uniref:Copper resistance protein D domain-containing protein n=1 Tax=Caldiarchaeum subterraneum TaxID=311458 RepID=A0A7C5LDW7_CALS0